MMKIQNKLNNHLDKKWMKKDWNFSLASDVEMVEAIEHYGGNQPLGTLAGKGVMGQKHKGVWSVRN